MHIRFGKGSNGRGPKTRLVPGINAAATVVNVAVATTFTYAVGEAWIGLCELLHDRDSEAVEAFMNSDEVNTVFMANFKKASKKAPEALR